MEILIYALVLLKTDARQLKARLEGMKGIGDAELFAITLDEISAVVCPKISPGLASGRSEALAYAGVIETLSEHFPLLPMRYGSVMESEEAILGMIQRNYPEMKRNLQWVEDKFEFGLKVFCDSAKIRSEIREKSEAALLIHPPANPSKPASVFREYVNAKLLEHRLEEMMVNYVDSIIAEIKDCFSLLNAAANFKKTLSEAILIDAVFLVERQRKNDLVSAIRLLQEKYPGLNLMLTGPWPPYSFVEITIK